MRRIAGLLAVAGAAVADEAVEWQAWGEGALERARRDGKQAFLTVVEATPRSRALGAVALAGPETVALLRRHFVAVRVEREERPDVAEIYASALILMDEEGRRPELPFALALTPEGRPLAGASLGRMSPEATRALLTRLVAEYKEKRAELEAKAGVTTLALREAQSSGAARGPLRSAVVERARRGLVESFDARRARFGAAGPPPPGALRLLLEEHARTGNAEALHVAVACLDALTRSGLPDRTGGAARLAPNALLLEAFARAHDVTGEPAHRQAAAAIAGWALEALRAPDGGLRAAVGDEGVDERVFVGENGLMIGALARSASLLGQREGLEAARRAASFILERLGPPAFLPRYALGEERHGSAYLEDYALLAEGLLDLHEATGEARWRAEATALVDAAVARFLDTAAGGFFETDAAHGPSIVRLRNGYDGALPSGNGVMASVLLRLSRASGETRYAELARRTVASFLADLEQAPRGLETLAAAAGELLGKPAAPAAAEALLPSRAVRGPVELGATLSATRARPGEALEAHVRLAIARGWRVNAHGPAAPGLVGLTVSVPGGGLVAAAPRYPEPTRVPGRLGPEPAYVGEVTVAVPLRLPGGATPGERRVRVRVGFQACREGDCQAPESALLEAPLLVTAR